MVFGKNDSRGSAKLNSFLIAIFGVSAAVLMFWVSDQGPGVSPDSMSYIETAKSLLSGKGFFIHSAPMTHFPPVYPILLSVVAMFEKGDVLQAGRWLAVILFGINTTLIGIAVKIGTKNSLLAVLSGMVLFLSFAPILLIHAMAWSEAPFIAFYLSAFILLSLYIVRPNPSLLILSSVAAGIAITTRYVGIALLPPIVAALMLLGERTINQKIKDTAIAVSVACLPLGIWLVRNLVTAESAANRSFAVHPFTVAHAKQLIDVVHDFAFPVLLPTTMKALNIGIAAVFFTAGILVLRHNNYLKHHVKSGHLALPALCFIFFLSYISMLVLSISFFDAHTPVDHRILLPALLALSIVVLWVGFSVSRVLGRRYIGYGLLVLVLLSCSIKADNALSKAMTIHKNGIGYTARYWRQAEIIQYIRNLPDDRIIYSNGPDLILLLTEKRATLIPKKVNPGTRRPNRNYEEQFRNMCNQCVGGKAVIAYIDPFEFRWYLPSKDELNAHGKLPVLHRNRDGVIYAKL